LRAELDDCQIPGSGLTRSATESVVVAGAKSAASQDEVIREGNSVGERPAENRFLFGLAQRSLRVRIAPRSGRNGGRNELRMSPKFRTLPVGPLPARIRAIPSFAPEPPLFKGISADSASLSHCLSGRESDWRGLPAVQFASTLPPLFLAWKRFARPSVLKEEGGSHDHP
jgi:hypothetical protein